MAPCTKFLKKITERGTVATFPTKVKKNKNTSSSDDMSGSTVEELKGMIGARKDVLAHLSASEQDFMIGVGSCQAQS